MPKPSSPSLFYTVAKSITGFVIGTPPKKTPLELLQEEVQQLSFDGAVAKLSLLNHQAFKSLVKAYGHNVDFEQELTELTLLNQFLHQLLSLPQPVEALSPTLLSRLNPFQRLSLVNLFARTEKEKVLSTDEKLLELSRLIQRTDALLQSMPAALNVRALETGRERTTLARAIGAKLTREEDKINALRQQREESTLYWLAKGTVSLPFRVIGSLMTTGENNGEAEEEAQPQIRPEQAASLRRQQEIRTATRRVRTNFDDEDLTKDELNRMIETSFISSSQLDEKIKETLAERERNLPLYYKAIRGSYHATRYAAAGTYNTLAYLMRPNAPEALAEVQGAEQQANVQNNPAPRLEAVVPQDENVEEDNVDAIDDDIEVQSEGHPEPDFDDELYQARAPLRRVNSAHF